MYFLQVAYVFANHVLEKASGMDGQHMTVDKKGTLIRKNRVHPPHVMTIGIRQEN